MSKPISRSQAILGGEIGLNGYFYRGGQFLPSTNAEPGKWKIGKKWVLSGRELVAPGVIAVQPTPFSRSILAVLGGYVFFGADNQIHLRDGCQFGNQSITLNTLTRPGVRGVLGQEEISFGELIDAYNSGHRWFDVKPDEVTVTSDAVPLEEYCAP